VHFFPNAQDSHSAFYLNGNKKIINLKCTRKSTGTLCFTYNQKFETYQFVLLKPEAAARTQPSRPRTLKKSEAKDRVASRPRTERLEDKAKDSRTRLKIRANINVNIAITISQAFKHKIV